MRKSARHHLRNLLESEAFGGISLITATVVALTWANSPFASSYFGLQHAPLELRAGGFRLELSLLHFVNDFLMAIFFLMVGLEIKRELVIGELATAKARVLPVAAALGGMAVPALLYAAFNAGGDGAAGWGIPMATDIAFALGVLALLGERVPIGLKIFLTALAIVDDLGAVLVIAIFYSQGLDLPSLLLSLAFWAAAAIYGWRGGQKLGVYLLIGLFSWYFLLQSGVHATIAGVLLAFTLPTRRDAHGESPLERLEHATAPWVSYLIVPVFALMNAGFAFGSLDLLAPVSLGAFFGLLIGKPLGIFGASYLAVRARWSELPAETSWKAIWGAGILGGIGFTMSLFVAALAFGEGSANEQAKLGVFSASALAAIGGLLFLRQVLPAPVPAKAAHPAPAAKSAGAKKAKRGAAG